jgi:hypothetical protein
VAVRVFAPAVVGVSEHVAVAVPPEPESAHGALVTVPSVTVTVPVGVAAPLARTTVIPTEIAVLTFDGSGVSEVIVVVVLTLAALIVKASVCGAPKAGGPDTVRMRGPVVAPAVTVTVAVSNVAFARLTLEAVTPVRLKVTV